MSALEQEIFDRFKLLDKDAKLRLAARLTQEAQEDVNATPKMSLKEWLDWASAFGDYIHEKYGTLPNSVDVLNEIREERLDDLMGGG
jgi:hypothetical protein